MFDVTRDLGGPAVTGLPALRPPTPAEAWELAVLLPVCAVLAVPAAFSVGAFLVLQFGLPRFEEEV